MMDPNIGWFHTENKGPALSLWMKLWKAFSIKSNDKFSANEELNYLEIVSKLRRQLNDNPSSTCDLDNNPQLIRKYRGIPWRNQKDTHYEGIDGLTQEIEDFYDYMKPKPKEYEIRTEVQTRITKVIESLWSDAVVSTSLISI